MSLDFFATQDARADNDEGLSIGYFIVQHFRNTGTELYGGVRWFRFRALMELADVEGVWKLIGLTVVDAKLKS